jgi:hypothetical protein
VFTRTRFKQLSRTNTHNYVLWLLAFDFYRITYSPPPSRCSQEVNLPFNAIIGRSALYRFMAISHYGYLVLKMSFPAGVLTVRGDRAAALAAVKKLHALTAKTTRPDDGGGTPPLPVPKRLPRCQRCSHPEQTTVPSKPSRLAWIPPRPLTSQAIWRKNRKSRSSPSSRQMSTYSHENRRRCLGSLGR